jgi:hypothetical protein
MIQVTCLDIEGAAIEVGDLGGFIFLVVSKFKKMSYISITGLKPKGIISYNVFWRLAIPSFEHTNAEMHVNSVLHSWHYRLIFKNCTFSFSLKKRNAITKKFTITALTIDLQKQRFFSSLKRPYFQASNYSLFIQKINILEFPHKF